MIEIKNLTKRYNGRTVVDNFSLSVPLGQIVGFLGANGAGKTTTLKMTVGISKPDSGTILLGGKNIEEESVKRNIGFMPELPSFYEYLTGGEFLSFCAALSHEGPYKNTRQAELLLEKVGLSEAKDLPIREYSKGMRQRLAFAQAIVHEPSYIFLDEPLDGLDPIGRKTFKQLIKNLKNEGKTVLFSSHILFDTEELCDEIAIIHRGQLIYSGDIPNFCKGKTLEEQFVTQIEAQK